MDSGGVKKEEEEDDGILFTLKQTEGSAIKSAQQHDASVGNLTKVERVVKNEFPEEASVPAQEKKEDQSSTLRMKSESEEDKSAADRNPLTEDNSHSSREAFPGNSARKRKASAMSVSQESESKPLVDGGAETKNDGPPAGAPTGPRGKRTQFRTSRSWSLDLYPNHRPRSLSNDFYSSPLKRPGSPLRDFQDRQTSGCRRRKVPAKVKPSKSTELLAREVSSMMNPSLMARGQRVLVSRPVQKITTKIRGMRTIEVAKLAAENAEKDPLELAAWCPNGERPSYYEKIELLDERAVPAQRARLEPGFIMPSFQFARLIKELANKEPNKRWPDYPFRYFRFPAQADPIPDTERRRISIEGETEVYYRTITGRSDSKEWLRPVAYHRKAEGPSTDGSTEALELKVLSANDICRLAEDHFSLIGEGRGPAVFLATIGMVSRHWEAVFEPQARGQDGLAEHVLMGRL